MNWPNRITLARIALAALLFALLASLERGLLPPSAANFWLALTLFGVAALTDALDGALARRLGQVTTLGRILDPFADKILTSGSLVLLAAGWPTVVPPHFALLVIAREYAVSAIRNAVEARGIPFGAQGPGKLKMVLQCAFIAVVFLELALSAAQTAKGSFALLQALRQVLLFAALFVTLYSAVWYARAAIRVLRPEGPPPASTH